MTSPLSGQLASLIFTGMRALFLDATYSVDTVTAGSPDVSFDPPAPTTTDYSCKAIVEKYNNYLTKQSGSLIQDGDRKLLVLANSISVTPISGGRFTISGVTFTVINVATDPATAVWEIQGRL